MVLFTTLVNFRLLSNGQIHEGLQLVISPETGTVLKRTGYIGGDIVDLEDAIIAPGFLECQVNGWAGVHFTELGKDSEEEAARKMEKVAGELLKKGVTGFWATVPTVAREEYEKVSPTKTCAFTSLWSFDMMSPS
jgi:N-acetylglucosamine-6-phosphate deacetylase